jgi:hypothetical protein
MIAVVFATIAVAAAWVALFGCPRGVLKDRVLLFRMGFAITWSMAVLLVGTCMFADQPLGLVLAAIIVIGAVFVESRFLRKSKPRNWLPSTLALCTLLVVPSLTHFGWAYYYHARHLLMPRSTFAVIAFGFHKQQTWAVIGCIVMSAVLWFRLRKSAPQSTQATAKAAGVFLLCVNVAFWGAFPMQGDIGTGLLFLFYYAPAFILASLVLLVSCIATYVRSTRRLHETAAKSEGR